MLHKNINNNKSTIVIHLLSRGNQSGEDRQCHDSASGATRQWPEKRRVDRDRDKQTSRRYLISGSFIGSRIKQSQQCPRKEFAKRVEQLSESKHLFGISYWNSRRNNNKTTKPKRICISLPDH